MYFKRLEKRKKKRKNEQRVNNRIDKEDERTMQIKQKKRLQVTHQMKRPALSSHINESRFVPGVE